MKRLIEPQRRKGAEDGVIAAGSRYGSARQIPWSSLRLCASAVLAVFLTACTVGPDYVKPAVEVPAAFKEAWKPAEPADEVPRGQWWRVFADAELDALEAQLETDSLSLKLAEAQYRQARALARGAEAALYPSLGVAAAATRAQSAGTATQAGALSSRYALNVTAAWEADLWGGIRYAVEAGRETAEASAGDLAAARLSLQAELAQAWFQLRALDAQKKILDDSVAAYGKSLEMTKNRYAAGVAGSADVAQAEAQFHATRAQALDVGVARAQTEHAIAILLGKAPSAFSAAARPLQASPPAHPAIPAGLPSKLLERRPDVAAAERRAAAANAQIGVARAAFFPTLSLSASAGWQGNALGGLIAASNRVWTLGPALAATLFDGGARAAREDQAVAAFDAASASYRQTVLTALKEAEDSLAALAILEKEADIQSAAVAAAAKSLTIARNQYQAGTVPYLNVLSAQTTLLAAEKTASDLQSRRLAAAVQLIKALGGGWASQK